jgi:hypothetical protein
VSTVLKGWRDRTNGDDHAGDHRGHHGDDHAPPSLGEGYLEALAAIGGQTSAAHQVRADQERQKQKRAPEPPLFRHIAEILAERREPLWLLPEILEQSVLAVLVGARGTFKSFIAFDWAMRAALADHGVAILSGEGAGLDRRADAWFKSFAPEVDPKTLPMVALERAIGLNHAAQLGAVADEIRAAAFPVQLVVIDTLSKLSPGMDENSNSEVAQFLSELAAELRDALKCTVLLVCHTGHGEKGRPRGAYTLMANPDAEYTVERKDPKGMHVTVTRDRFKDYAALSPLGYIARVVDLGRADKYGKAVTSLVLDPREPLETLRVASHGKNQTSAMNGLREWARANPESNHISSDELTALLKTQGLRDRNRRYEAVVWLCQAGVLTPAVGGHTLNRSAL